MYGLENRSSWHRQSFPNRRLVGRQGALPVAEPQVTNPFISGHCWNRAIHSLLKLLDDESGNLLYGSIAARI